MRFLTIYKTAETGLPPTPEQMAEMGKLIEEMTSRGALLSTEGCLPSATGARVRRSGGKVTVTDGPFTEAKELIAGFALIEAKSKEEAIELTKRFLEVAGDGESEIRQIFEGPGSGCEPSAELHEPAQLTGR
ncbi:MAG: YciI family protein [Gemmatimonadales bacterium]